MKDEMSIYSSPEAMEPLFPEDTTGILEFLSIELMKKSARLSGTINPDTRRSIADFLRPMNSYYSNLIEGHDTHPIDIFKALNNDYAHDISKRDLQKEARAHIKLHEDISSEIRKKKNDLNPASSDYIRSLHQRFYEHLPESFTKVKSKEGKIIDVIPGEFRNTEVEVGQHIAPYSKQILSFMKRFEEIYDPRNSANRSPVRRMIAIAASHHRLAWIHPFVDGNGRVMRLFADAFFIYENADASGLWSISRGLARRKDEYQTRLSNADLKRENNYDGRGNLSNKRLVEFCKFFLEVAIDQIEYMYNMIDVERMISRINSFTDLMVSRNILRPEAKYLLTEVFLRGKISKPEAMRITNTTDKTLKKTTDLLIEMDLLIAKKEGILMMYYVKYPIKFAPILFPGMYPADKEMKMMKF